jgi:predicted amidophosphoribosyltransferase
MRLQSILRLIYPPQCIACAAPSDAEFGLCGACWRDAGFTSGLVCDKCGEPLPGEATGADELCDDCLAIARPWTRGRAAMLYGPTGRRVALALKHGDRLDLARPAAEWMLRAARPILTPGMLVAPVPLHWMRLARRRYNQSALLSARIARSAGLDHCPDLLIRPRATESQDGRDRNGRFGNLAGAIQPHPSRGAACARRDVLLVDDVMTSGATLAASTEACMTAGAHSVAVVTLARVAKAP